jgi:hypothetical protein
MNDFLAGSNNKEGNIGAGWKTKEGGGKLNVTNVEIKTEDERSWLHSIQYFPMRALC